VEIALSTVLVALGVLLIASFQSAASHERGYDPDHLIAVSVEPLSAPEGEDALAFFSEVESRVHSIPGVESVSLSSHEITEQRGFRFPVRVAEMPPSNDGEYPLATLRVAAPNLFKTVGIPLIAGRDLEHGGAGEWGFVVNERFVDLLVSRGTDPLGVRVELPWLAGAITGVVGNVTPEPGEPAEPTLYVPFDAVQLPGMWLSARLSPSPSEIVPEIRRRIQSLDPSAPLERVVIASESVRAAVASERFNMVLASTFAVLALTLAAVGVYGVTSFSVAARKREIGIRRALGAPGLSVTMGVVKRIGVLGLVGVCLGLFGAYAGGGVLESILVGTTPTDPRILALVAFILIAVGVAATAVPVSHAMRIDPTGTLREE